MVNIPGSSASCRFKLHAYQNWILGEKISHKEVILRMISFFLARLLNRCIFCSEDSTKVQPTPDKLLFPCFEETYRYIATFHCTQSGQAGTALFVSLEIWHYGNLFGQALFPLTKWVFSVNMVNTRTACPLLGSWGSRRPVWLPRQRNCKPAQLPCKIDGQCRGHSRSTSRKGEMKSREICQPMKTNGFALDAYMRAHAHCPTPFMPLSPYATYAHMKHWNTSFLQVVLRCHTIHTQAILADTHTW